MTDALAAALAARERAGLLRRRRVVEAANGVRVTLDGRTLVSFSSNDYLGLADHPAIAQSFADAARRGTGAGAAHLVTGHRREHHALEEALADYTRRERALLFSTGYMANLGIGTAFTDRHALVIEDRLNHASLIDAARIGGARVLRYAHADAHAARERLAAAAPRKFIFTDGVFSMDGDVAPVNELARVAREHRATLVVDDAHGLGVLGANGGGTLEAAALDEDDVPLLVGTLGKAFGVAGAFVAGPAEYIETLVQHARTYVYTTAQPPAVAAATLTALEVSRDESWRRERVLASTMRFRERAAREGVRLSGSTTPIQPVMVGDAHKAVTCADALERAGFLVTPIRPPTVPDGSARLRVTLSAAHTDEQVDALVTALAEALA